MVDTLRIRIHALNDVRNTLGDEISVSNGFDEFLYVCPSHNELYIKMLQYKGKHFSSTLHSVKNKWTVNELTEDQIIRLAYGNLNKHEQIRDVLTFSDEKRTKSIYKSFTGNYSVPSSHHGITFTVNDNAGFIDFQLSVPKYLYGSSLAQFVPQIHSSLYERSYKSAHGWRFQQTQLYGRLTAFLDKFLDDLQTMFSIDKPFNKDYIELVRIDLCFNQYFESKEKALKALNELKKMNNRRKRVNKSVTEEYETSLTYQSAEGSYFKIYHKGTEYSESKFGDLKKHMKINMDFIDGLQKSVDYDKVYKKSSSQLDEIIRKRSKDLKGVYDPVLKKAIYKKYRNAIRMIFENRGKGLKSVLDPDLKELIKSTVYDVNKKLPFKVDFFKAEMDKILRYEVSIKGSYLTYLYKNKVFRANCPYHNEAVETFKYVHSIFYSTDIRKADRKVSKEQKRVYDMINTYNNRKVFLTFSDSRYLRRFEKNGIVDFDERNLKYDVSRYDMRYTALANGDVGIFSPRLLDFCVKHFYKLVKYYQVEKLSEYDNIVAMVETYNNGVKARVDEYNKDNHYLTIDHLGKRMVKGNKIITKASQLLSRNELNDKGFKTVNTLVILTILRFMRSGRSLDECFKEMGLSKYQQFRYRKDLEIFHITSKSFFLDENLETCTDFKTYYEKCESKEYLNKMYVKQIMRSYG